MVFNGEHHAPQGQPHKGHRIYISERSKSLEPLYPSSIAPLAGARGLPLDRAPEPTTGTSTPAAVPVWVGTPRRGITPSSTSSPACADRSPSTAGRSPAARSPPPDPPPF